MSEGRDFPEVLLVVDDVDLGDDPVAGAADLVERLGLAVRRWPATPRRPWSMRAGSRRSSTSSRRRSTAQLLDRRAARGAEGEPLVTVRIPTFGSVDLLLERAIPSVLAGSYRNVELLVCSDGPQPHARAAVEGLTDPRVRYLERQERPHYPSRASSFWQVAGTSAVNRLVDEARGDLIAPLDHDDAFTHDHIPVLLDALRRGRGLRVRASR